MFDGRGFGAAIVVFGLLCAFVGWGVISLIIWLFLLFIFPLEADCE